VSSKTNTGTTRLPSRFAAVRAVESAGFGCGRRLRRCQYTCIYLVTSAAVRNVVTRASMTSRTGVCVGAVHEAAAHRISRRIPRGLTPRLFTQAIHRGGARLAGRRRQTRERVRGMSEGPEATRESAGEDVAESSVRRSRGGVGHVPYSLVFVWNQLGREWLKVVSVTHRAPVIIPPLQHPKIRTESAREDVSKPRHRCLTATWGPHRITLTRLDRNRCRAKKDATMTRPSYVPPIRAAGWVGGVQRDAESCRRAVCSFVRLRRIRR